MASRWSGGSSARRFSAKALALWFAAATVFAAFGRGQETVGPSVEVAGRGVASPLGEIVAARQDSPLLFQAPVEPLLPQQAARRPAARRLLRQVGGSATWLSGGDQGLGLAEFRGNATAIVPLMAFGSPLLVSPSFGLTLLDDPPDFDLPNELYRVSASLTWVKQANERLSYTLGITPGVSSDFAATEGAFRMFGFGAVAYQWKPAVQLTLGAAYTGRNDIPVLPMAGLVWTPNDDFRLELSAPRPRIAKRLRGLPLACDGAADWVYFAGEMGGGTWAVERAGGVEDELTLRDFRLVVGVERKSDAGAQGRFEIGYVIGREVEFETSADRFDPSDALMLRTGFRF